MVGSSRKPALSVVVPLYNEGENVVSLYSAIVSGLEKFDDAYEIIFVDDGSSDDTRDKMLELANSDRRLKLIIFRRNFGQTPAMAAGIDHARGSIIVTMDGDLQNDPRDIVELVERIESGFDLAVGWRFQRQDKLITRKIPSRIANWLIGKVTGVPIKDNGCSLKAYRAELIKRIPLYSEMHRFIPAMSSMGGARIAEIKVRHHARQHGISKYGLSRIYKVLFDLIAIKTLISFSARPLRWFGALASPFALVASCCLIWAIWQSIGGGQSLSLITSLAITFASGATFILICGVLCELIYKVGETRPTDFFLVPDMNYYDEGTRINQENESDS
ncbi:MAG: glycosyltransferase family 2 protein [Proteobacteria bacterium]|nr:glycosyltransferase family 2 protein [Pseudomonadota bacterium]